MNGVLKTCAWCGASYYGDGRHRYCSEECAAAKHREDCRIRFRQRYAANPQEGRARKKAYYAAHRERVLAQMSGYNRNYYAKNREKLLAKANARNQARKAAAT